MFDKLLYRIQSPLSGARMVSGLGILSRDSIRTLRSPFPDPFNVPAKVPSPKIVRPDDIFIHHLTGYHCSTPFVSTTSDFFRAISIASQHFKKRHPESPEDVKLFVIDPKKISGTPRDSLAYLQQLPLETRSQLDDFEKLINTIRINSEFVVPAGVPEVAIIQEISIAQLLRYLPSWLLTSDGYFILPSRWKSLHRSWLSIASARYSACKKQNVDFKSQASKLADVLLDHPDDAEGIARAIALSDLLSKRPSLHRY